MTDGKPVLKHVERFTEINKLSNVVSCWLYFGNVTSTTFIFGSIMYDNENPTAK